MKYCPCCKQTLDFSKFTKCKTRKDGLNVYCAACCKQKRDSKKETYNKQRNLKWSTDPKYREKYLEYHRQRYVTEKEKLKEKAIAFYSIPENLIKAKLTSIKARCEAKGIPFDLELKDIQLNTHCKYLGIELDYSRGSGRRDNSPSLDRIDPTKGYIKGNIEIISDKANRMKNNATKEELITFSKFVLKEAGYAL